jgi:hypothetical protein
MSEFWGILILDAEIKKTLVLYRRQVRKSVGGLIIGNGGWKVLKNVYFAVIRVVW